jgi:hypothetical protein
MRLLVGRLGAFFNPKRLDQIRLSLTAGVSVADVGSDVFSVSVNYRAGLRELGACQPGQRGHDCDSAH